MTNLAVPHGQSYRGGMNDAPDNSAAPALQRTLGGWQVLFYGLGSMLGAGIYGLVGKGAGIMGNAIWAGFVTAMVAALLTGLSYASVGSRHPKAGGAAYITGRAFRSPVLSTTVGVAVMMSGLTSMATGLQVIAVKLLESHQGEKLMKFISSQSVLGWLDSSLSIKCIAIAIAALVGVVIFRGIRESIWLNTLCTVIEAGGLLFIIAVGCRFWGSVDYFETPPVVAGSDGVGGLTAALLMQGALLTFFSFIGFEDILNVSEEVKNPRRDVPFGLVGAMILATLIYVAVAITAVSVLGWEALSKSEHPLDEVAARAAPWFTGLDKVFYAVTIFAIGNTALLNYLMGSRLLYGMGTQGLLPPVLSRIHSRRQTPHVAIVCLFAIVAALVSAGDVKALAEATVLLLLAVFALMNAALVILKRRPGEEHGGFEIPVLVPVLGALVCAVLFGNRLYQAVISKDDAMRTAPLVALAILAAGMVIGMVRGKQSRV